MDFAKKVDGNDNAITPRTVARVSQITGVLGGWLGSAVALSG